MSFIPKTPDQAPVFTVMCRSEPAEDTESPPAQSAQFCNQATQAKIDWVPEINKSITLFLNHCHNPAECGTSVTVCNQSGQSLHT